MKARLNHPLPTACSKILAPVVPSQNQQQPCRLSGVIDMEDEPRCQDCDEPVSEHFARVFGDNNKVAHACYSCSGYDAITQGAASGVKPQVQNSQKSKTVVAHRIQPAGCDPGGRDRSISRPITRASSE